MRRVLVRAIVAGVLVALALPVSVVGAAPPGERLSPEGLHVEADDVVSPDWSHVVFVGGDDEALYTVPTGGGEVVRLSPPFTRGGGDVQRISFALSPDSRWVVFSTYPAEGTGVWDQRQGEWDNGLWELFAVPIGGGSPIKLSEHVEPPNDDPRFQGVVMANSHLVSLDSTRVIVSSLECGDRDDESGCEGGEWELYSVPIQGGAQTPLAQRSEVSLEQGPWEVVTPDSSRVLVHLQDYSGSGFSGLSSVPINGGTITDLAEGDDFVVSPDFARVVYQHRSIDEESDNLYSIPVDGGTPVRLNAPFPSGGDVLSDFVVSPDSALVVYQSGGLFSVPIGGGTPVRLNAPLVPGGYVHRDFVMSPDSAWVLYRTYHDGGDAWELFSVPSGGGTPVRVPGGDLHDFVVSPDSSQVVYGAEGEIFTVPIGGGDAVTLGGPKVNNSGVSIQAVNVFPDSSHAIYTANPERRRQREMFAAPLVGGPTVKLNMPEADNVRSFVVSPDSSLVVYRTGGGLFSVDITRRCDDRLASIRGSRGADTITGTSGPDVIMGLAGNDTISGRGGADVICGGSGNDIIRGGSGADIIRGKQGSDTIYGGPGPDTIYGNRARDTIYGNSAPDILYGGTGADIIEGGKRGDTIYGRSGDDLLRGNTGHDHLDGGKGDDTCRGGPGNDTAHACETATSL